MSSNKKNNKTKIKESELLTLASIFLDEWKHRDTILWTQTFRFYIATLTVTVFPYLDICDKDSVDIFPYYIFHITSVIMSVVFLFITWSYSVRLRAASDTYARMMDSLDIYCKRDHVEDVLTKKVTTEKPEEKSSIAIKLAKARLAKWVPMLLFSSLIVLNIIILIFEN